MTDARRRDRTFGPRGIWGAPRAAHHIVSLIATMFACSPEPLPLAPRPVSTPEHDRPPPGRHLPTRYDRWWLPERPARLPAIAVPKKSTGPFVGLPPLGGRPSVDVILQNEHDEPTWFVLHDASDIPPPADEKLRCADEYPLRLYLHDFKGFRRQGGIVVVPILSVSCGSSYTLLELAPRSTLTLQQFAVTSSPHSTLEPAHVVHIWESNGPQLDGEPIADWLNRALVVDASVEAVGDIWAAEERERDHDLLVTPAAGRDAPREFDIASVRHFTWVPDPERVEAHFAYPDLAPPPGSSRPRPKGRSHPAR